MRDRIEIKIESENERIKSRARKITIGVAAGTAEYIGAASLLQKIGCNIALHPGQMVPSNVGPSLGLFAIFQFANLCWSAGVERGERGE